MQAILVVTTICQIINIREATTEIVLEKNMFCKSKKNTYRSNCPQMFFKIDVLKNVAIFKEKQLCWSSFLMKFIKEAPAQAFSVKIAQNV